MATKAGHKRQTLQRQRQLKRAAALRENLKRRRIQKKERTSNDNEVNKGENE